MPHRYWIFALLSFSTAINDLDRQALSVIVPTLRSEMAMSSREYGDITTAFLVAYCVGQIIAGGVVDRIGTRWGLAVFVAGEFGLAASFPGRLNPFARPGISRSLPIRKRRDGGRLKAFPCGG